MSGHGRRAELPAAGHHRPEVLADGALVVRHVNAAGRMKEYDFALLPVAEAMRHSLAALFAARCAPSRWTAHGSSENAWRAVHSFARFLARQSAPPADLGGLSAGTWLEWVAFQPGRPEVSFVSGLLLQDPRVRQGPAADAITRRRRRPPSRTQSFTGPDWERIVTTARRTFRAAVLRIEDNARHLVRWRAGELPERSQEWAVGDALDELARTGDLPRYDRGPTAQYRAYYTTALGGMTRTSTWMRLFLSRHEAVCLAVLLTAEFGWNLAVIDRLAVPAATPSAGAAGPPTYRIVLDKRRRTGRRFETRNVTDFGADSSGRLITQALAVTRFARALVEEQAPGTDRLVVWRAARRGVRLADQDRDQPVGPFHLGIDSQAAQEWVRAEGLPGSPFRRGRRTVNALVRRESGQNSQDTHDSIYVLSDPRVAEQAAEVIAGGASAAEVHARHTVLAAELRDHPDPADTPTATADCTDYRNGPYPGPDGDCGASFLMCLGCTNARVHPGHHPRLAHLHHAVANLRTVLPPARWDAQWGEAHQRLDDLKARLDAPVWGRTLAGVGEADRALVAHLLSGDLNP
ncbi:hypothetical protein ACFV4P_13335 [Kitasatospora sp. NPDC059795]|uniref:hypothetical protein n=1 Tax=Kitasatospora sp. NPDC059795 TaxID=3346949 RepID=UPI003660A417